MKKAVITIIIVAIIAAVFVLSTSGIYLGERREMIEVSTPAKTVFKHELVWCRYFKLPDLFVEKRYLAKGVTPDVIVPIGTEGHVMEVTEESILENGCPHDWFAWKSG